MASNMPDVPFVKKNFPFPLKKRNISYGEPIMKTTPKTVNAKLKQADPQIQDYIRNITTENSELRKQNRILERKVASREVKNISAANRISALHIEIKRLSKTVNYKVSWDHPEPPVNNR